MPYLRVDNEVGHHPVLLQIRVSFMAVAILHFIRSVQVLQSDRGDVNTSAREHEKIKKRAKGVKSSVWNHIHPNI